MTLCSATSAVLAGRGPTARAVRIKTSEPRFLGSVLIPGRSSHIAGRTTGGGLRMTMKARRQIRAGHTPPNGGFATGPRCAGDVRSEDWRS